VLLRDIYLKVHRRAVRRRIVLRDARRLMALPRDEVVRRVPVGELPGRLILPAVVEDAEGGLPQEGEVVTVLNAVEPVVCVEEVQLLPREINLVLLTRLRV
jgi:hypothetical protein